MTTTFPFASFFPFASLVAEHRELGLVAAVALGFGFGFVLERAGFGRANKLAAQFYFYDMTVFKVMFGAIVTAMLGLGIASGLGLADLKALSEGAASETFVWPMLVGGLLLGAGFIVSGYCPGTSLVAASSGNLDGLVAFTGVAVGTLVFDEIFPWVKDFHMSGALGHTFLHDLLGLPQAVLATGVALMAIAAFVGADKLEGILARRGLGATPEPHTLQNPLRPRRIAFGVFAALAVLALATLAVPTQPAAASVVAKKVEWISQETLSRRILEQPWSLRILDLRPQAECAARRVPGAECTPAPTLASLGLGTGDGARDLVLVTAQAPQRAPKATLAWPGRIYLLKGGFAGWQAFALDKPPAAPPGDDPKGVEQWKLRVALNSALTGRKPAAPPAPSAAPGAVAPKKKKKGGCS